MFLWRFIHAKCAETGVRDAEAAAAAPAVPWADLPRELIGSIAAAAGLSLRDYTCLRGVCSAWRSAIAPPLCACLLSLADDHGRHSASVFSLLMRRWFHLHALSSDLHDPSRLLGVFDFLLPIRRQLLLSAFDQRPRARLVGSGNGRFALAVDQKYRGTDGWRRIFLVDPRAGQEIELVSPPRAHQDECVRKIVFAPNPNYDWTVVALCDSNKVAYIDGKVDRNWMAINVVNRYLIDLAFFDAGHELYCYCLDSQGGVHALRTPRGGQNDRPNLVWRCYFNPAAFARPYDVIYELTSTKHIFFCRGILYQVWQNNSCDVSSGTGYFKMSSDEIFVLRYRPGRSVCWDAVRDLGGCSVFIGKKSSPTVVRAGAVHGVRGDCVYWIDSNGVPMVCDIATGNSKPCMLPYDACKGDCWYFGDDNMMNINDDRRNERH